MIEFRHVKKDKSGAMQIDTIRGTFESNQVASRWIL